MTKDVKVRIISEMQGVLKGVFVCKMFRILLPNFVVKKVQTLPTKKTPNRSHFGQTAGEPATTLSQWKPRRGFEMVWCLDMSDVVIFMESWDL